MAWWQVALWGLAAVEAMMVVVWVGSLAQRDASLVDRFWGPAFVLLAWVYALVGDGDPARETLLLVLVTIWGLRLGGFITWRNWGEGEDPRYAAMRERDPEGFPRRSLVTVFLLQGLLAWIIAAPLFAVATDATPAGLTWVDLLAIPVWLVGFVFEAGGDWQLERFKADPANRGKVMDRGLWRYTRHPNYFGDTVQWAAYGLLGLAVGAWWSLVGPIAMTALIVRVSGVALTDRNMSKGSKREGYEEYVRRTNAFIPGPRAPAD
jgi:steroid 5-alpha reductase family enzyme